MPQDCIHDARRLRLDRVRVPSRLRNLVVVVAMFAIIGTASRLPHHARSCAEDRTYAAPRVRDAGTQKSAPHKVEAPTRIFLRAWPSREPLFRGKSAFISPISSSAVPSRVRALRRVYVAATHLNRRARAHSCSSTDTVPRCIFDFAMYAHGAPWSACRVNVRVASCRCASAIATLTPLSILIPQQNAQNNATIPCALLSRHRSTRVRTIHHKLEAKQAATCVAIQCSV